MSYFPLNVKTCYNFLKSNIRIPSYIKKAKEYGFQMLGISDESPYAFMEFSKECEKHNITPILGSQISIIYQNEKRLINLFVVSEIGYQNLCLIYHQIEDGIYQGDFENTEGIIAIIPTLSGNWFNHKSTFEQQRELLFPLQKKFEHFLLGTECYSESDKDFLKKVYEFADSSSYTTIAFPLAKAINKEDGLVLNILNAIENNETLEINSAQNTPYFILGEAALKAIYRELDFASFDLFKNASFKLNKKRGKLLSYPCDGDKKETLYALALTGLKKRNIDIDENYISRLNKELDIITSMGYLDYFFIVHDYVTYAKNNAIPVGVGRGSAAGSLISYALEITDINPLEYDLLFERFLNPERVSMPDIDIDFADYHREDIISYIVDRYGEDKVKNIITFQTFGPKQALKDIGKVFSFNQTDINKLLKSLGNNDSFLAAYKTSSDFKALINDNHYSSIATLARKLEGLPRQKGQHAAGIIINNDPLYLQLPLTKDKNVTCPFEMNYLEELGYLKMDILGLRNLSIIESIQNRLKEDNINIELVNIPLDDKKTLAIFNNGLTKGIFQFESGGITSALKEVGIDSFNDIVAVNALYRPGPMANIKTYAENKKNPSKIKYTDDRLRPILQSTYGIIVYQEQVMEIVRVIAGFSLSKADIFRRAISKKKAEVLEDLKKDFIKGALENGLSLNKAEDIYHYILQFGDYGFNKSHSVSYAFIAYQMAYLKANYPLYFYASLFDYEVSSSSHYSSFYHELRYFNIHLSKPCINKSSNRFVIEDTNLIIPLDAIKGISKLVSEAILQERKKGLFITYHDFIRRTYPYKITRDQYLSLINAGALDCFSLNRKTLTNALANALSFVDGITDLSAYSKEEIALLEPIIKIYPENESEKNELEFETLGVLLSGSLFKKYSHYLKSNNIESIENVFNNIDKFIKFMAIYKDKRIITTKTNKKMALIHCYDETDELVVLAFTDLYERLPEFNKGDPLLISGTLRKDKRGISFIASDIIKMEEDKNE